MTTEPYLMKLGLRLAEGLDHLDPERRARHLQFVLTRQMPDGGFAGREDESDLYYTSFAVRSLAILDGLGPAECDSIGSFLIRQNTESLGMIDLVSWLYSAIVVQLSGGPDVIGDSADRLTQHVMRTADSIRVKDGGFAKTTAGAAGSTYHSFMVCLAYELIGEPIPRPNALIQFLYDRQRDDGGFVEIAPMKRSGTNPTAAAVAMLTMLDAMDDDVRRDVISFLREIRSSEGGFQANTRIPFADGLSTFTGLLTAQDLSAGDLLDVEQTESLVSRSLEFPTGGFRGATWDDQADVEYTFYGLGVVALLNNSRSGS